MSNDTHEIGMRPVGADALSVANGHIRACLLPSSVASDVCLFTPVVLAGGSNSSAITTLTNVYDPGRLQNVALATVGSNPITGVIVGFDQAYGSSDKVYGPASTNRVVFITCDRNQIYEIRDDGGVALTTAAIGHNAVLIAGTDTSDKSCSGIRMDTGTTTAPASGNATYQLRILGVAPILNTSAGTGKNVAGKNCVWRVKINNFSEGEGTGTVGV